LFKETGHSRRTLKRKIGSWLDKSPPVVKDKIAKCKYASFDAKYIRRGKFCIFILFDNQINLPVYSFVAGGEDTKNITLCIKELKSYGFDPIAITLDGGGAAIKCFQQEFPKILIQRCLVHVQRQLFPGKYSRANSELGVRFKKLIRGITKIENKRERNQFWRAWNQLCKEYSEYEKANSYYASIRVYKDDAERCIKAIAKIRDHLFLYLDDPKIAKTTNALEGFNKQISHINGFDHNGQSLARFDNFVAWFVFFKHEKGSKSEP
jgi:hypothetical protein